MIYRISIFMNILVFIVVTMVLYIYGPNKLITSINNKYNNYINPPKTSKHPERYTGGYHLEYDKIDLLSNLMLAIDNIMLGDSITEQLAWNEYVKNTTNRGIEGYTTKGILKVLPIVISKKPKRVFIMLGINDIIVNKNVEDIFTNYKEIIDILGNNNIDVIITSTLFVNFQNIVDMKTANKKVSKLNDLLKKYVKNNNLTYIDLNLKLANGDVIDVKHVRDGIHLNQNAYIIWINLINNFLVTNHDL